MKYVFVNRHRIMANRKTSRKKAVIGIRKGLYGKARYVNTLKVGTAFLVYRPDKPLPCGATVYLEIP